MEIDTIKEIISEEIEVREEILESIGSSIIDTEGNLERGITDSSDMSIIQQKINFLTEVKSFLSKLQLQHSDRFMTTKEKKILYKVVKIIMFFRKFKKK